MASSIAAEWPQATPLPAPAHRHEPLAPVAMAMGARPSRIVLNRHQGTEIQGDGASPGTGVLFNTLDQVLGECSTLVRTPPYYPMDARTSLRIAIDCLRGADACLFGVPRRPTDLDPFFVARARLCPRLPVLYLPLGEFPRGAWLYRHLWRHLGPTDALLFSCRADLAVYQRLVAASPAQAEVLPFGIDTDRFAVPPGGREEVRRHFGLGTGEVLMVYHGRVCPEKNVTGALRLLRELKQRGLPVRLWVIGPIAPVGPVGPMVAPGGAPRRLDQLPPTPFLASLARELPSPALLDSVSFWGELPRHALPPLLGAADLAVQLTLNPDENFGFATVEAMAAGLPVLGSDWGGLKDTIDHGETGWRIPTSVQGDRPTLDDGQALRRAVSLITDPMARQRMGRAARRRAVDHYGLRRWTLALQAILQRQIGQALRPDRARVESPHRWSELGTRLAAAYHDVAPDGPYDTLPRRVPPFHSFEEQPLMREVMAAYASDSSPETSHAG